MNIILCIALLAYSVLLGSCSRAEQELEASTLAKEPPQMIQIRNLSVTDKTLTFDYRILNPFDDGIWVCYDLCVHGEQGTQDTSTRIDDETVWIKLRFNLGPSGGFENPPAVAKYVRLRPGEFHDGRIVRNLPIKIYVVDWRADRKRYKEMVLHRFVFEVGYYAPKWNDYFSRVSERIKKEPDKSKPMIAGSNYYLSANPFITEEQLDGKLRGVFYISNYTSFIKNEESTEVLIIDVDIPCSVVVDDQ